MFILIQENGSLRWVIVVGMCVVPKEVPVKNAIGDL